MMDITILRYLGQVCTCSKGSDEGSRTSPDLHDPTCAWRKLAESDITIDLDERLKQTGG